MSSKAVIELLDEPVLIYPSQTSVYFARGTSLDAMVKYFIEWSVGRAIH
jgi:hypothetical protein